MNDQQPSTRELAERRADYLTGLMWHIGSFVIINAFFWFLDAFVGQDGIQWASWITVFWGLALLFHLLAWFIDGRQVARRRAQRYVERERSNAR